MRIAAVDVGSNTVHVQVCDVEGDTLVDVGHHSLLPGVVAAVRRTGEVGPEMTARATADLRTVLDHAREHWGYDHLIAGATEAIRRASDSDRFLAACGEVAGVPFHLISGAREAQLSFAGVALRHGGRGDWLMADLGGGSTELVLGRGRRMGRWASLPIGSGALAGEFLSDPPQPDERARLRSRAVELLAGAPEVDVTRLVATGGTAGNLPLLVSRRHPPALLTVDALLKAEQELDRRPAAEVAGKFGLEPARVSALRGGVEVLLLLLDYAGLSQLHVSYEGLRHGMILAYRERGDSWWREEETESRSAV